MLPLHSQDTAAIYINIEQALPSIIKFGNVFNKQTGRAREMIKKIKITYFTINKSKNLSMLFF